MNRLPHIYYYNREVSFSNDEKKNLAKIRPK